MSMKFEYALDGDPVPTARPRFGKGGRAYQDARSREAQAEHRQAGRLALPEGWPKGARYAVKLAFVLETRRKKDWDNLSKTIGDGLNGVAWDDDSQIRDATVKIIDGAPGEGMTYVTVEVLDE